jgi:hypothetical protein
VAVEADTAAIFRFWMGKVSLPICPNFPVGKLRLTEWHVREDARNVDLGNQAHFTEISLPLAVLAFCQVTTTLLPTQHFPGTSDLESLSDGFPCFASCYGFSHRRAGW